MSTEVEIGRSKRALRAYSFDDIALVPARRTRDTSEVRVGWQIDAYHVDLPVMASPMDSVMSPETAIMVGRLGGIGEPRGHRLRPDAVGLRRRPPDERRRDQAVAGRVHSGGLGVEAEQGAQGPGGASGNGGVGHGGGVRGAHETSMPPGCDINAPVPACLARLLAPACTPPPRRSLRWIPDRAH